MAHIGVVVRDTAVSARFYEMLLGATNAGGWENERLKVVNLRIGEETLELLQFKAPYEPRQTGTLDHIAFWVDDIHWYAAVLRDFGVTMEDEAPRTLDNGLTIMFLRGPDGERIELIERR